MTLNMPLVNTISKLLKRGETAGQFRPDVDPVELYISIAGVSYLYFSNLHTLSEIFGRDLSSKEELKKRRQHVVDVILGYLCHPVSQPSVTVDKSRKKSNEN